MNSLSKENELLQEFVNKSTEEIRKPEPWKAINAEYNLKMRKAALDNLAILKMLGKDFEVSEEIRTILGL